MSFLDKSGVQTLWAAVKKYVASEASGDLGWKNQTTTFSSDGNTITTTGDDGTTVTVIGTDLITQTNTKNGVISNHTVTFNSDGSISEVKS